VNKKNAYLYIVAGIFIVTGAVAGLAYSFALPEEIKEVVIDSDHYGDPGSYRVTKSASWIDSDTAKIRFDFDSIVKTDNRNYDILLVLDTSDSMTGKKLSFVKHDSIELINSVLSDSNNRMGLVTFNSNSQVVSEFTNNKTNLIDIINGLVGTEATNYHDALVKVDNIMKNYQREDGKDCVVLFLTDGYPNKDVSNGEGQYKYLKSQYPYLQINAVQYEMGENVINELKKISDRQFVAHMDTLSNVLFDASISPVLFEQIEIVDYINLDYFNVKSINDIHASVGTVELKDGDSGQQIVWKFDKLMTGVNANLEIVVNLQDNYINEDIYMPTNIQEIITTKLEGEEETVKTSNVTPVLGNYHRVKYELTFPDDCTLKSISSSKYKTGELVFLESLLPNC